MKILDCEIGGDAYERELEERATLALAWIETPITRITPDKAMAARLAHVFATLSKPRRDAPETALEFERRTAFLTALDALGIRYEIEDTKFFGFVLHVADCHGQRIDLAA